jgi:hypothetical protein
VVFTTIQRGAVHTTSDGQRVVLKRASIAPNRSTGNSLGLQRRKGVGLECPRELDCEFIPAAYTLNNPADPTDYGN